MVIFLKKILCLSILIILAITNFSVKNNYLFEVNFNDNYLYYLYLNNTNFEFSNCEEIINGNGLIVKTTKHNAKNCFYNSVGILGEAVQIFTNNPKLKLNEITNLLKIKNVNSYVINNILVIEGYTNLINIYILNNNKKVNVQIAINKNSIIVGCPLILHSF
jgi:hypothetical protein